MHARSVGAVDDRNRHAGRAVVESPVAGADEPGIVEGFGKRLGHLDRHRIRKVNHGIFHERHRDAVVDAPQLRRELHVIERGIRGRGSGVLTNRPSGKATRPTSNQHLALAHRDVPSFGREHAELVHKPDDFAGQLGAGQHATERIDAARLGASLDAVVSTPPASLFVAEQRGLDGHARTVRPLLALETAKGPVILRHGKHLGTALHGGGLLGGLGLLDALGRGTTLQHGAEFQLLRLHALQELDSLAELVGTLLKAAKRRLLLLVHGLGGSLTLGGVLGHRLHLGDNGSQFVEQCLDLVHEVSLLVRVRRPLPPIPRN